MKFRKNFVLEIELRRENVNVMKELCEVMAKKVELSNEFIDLKEEHFNTVEKLEVTLDEIFRLLDRLVEYGDEEAIEIMEELGQKKDKEIKELSRILFKKDQDNLCQY